MKKKELNESRNKDIAKLNKDVDGLKLKIEKLLTERKVKGDKNVKLVKFFRRDLAQTLTLIREKSLAQGSEKREEEEKKKK